MIDWHARFCQQAGWTQALRAYLFAQAGLAGARRVLEAGCGTGAILTTLETRAIRHGLDVSREHLAQCAVHARGSLLACGDVCCLPYADGAFDISYCHFLLLWTADPLAALVELRRVTRPGGSVLALAEPDYSQRVDRPEALVTPGRLQTEALRGQGADPDLGGRLAALFAKAGIELIEAGTLQRGALDPLSPGEGEQEWAVLETDLMGRASGEDIQKWKKLDQLARRRGERVLHVPTYFAWGRAP